MSASTLCTIIEGTTRPVQNVRGLILKLHFPLSETNGNRPNADFILNEFSYIFKNTNEHWETCKNAVMLSTIVNARNYRNYYLFYYAFIFAGEASVDTVFDTPRWQYLSENENCPEPKITNANYVYRLMPNLKVILLLRNPVDR